MSGFAEWDFLKYFNGLILGNMQLILHMQLANIYFSLSQNIKNILKFGTTRKNQFLLYYYSTHQLKASFGINS